MQNARYEPPLLEDIGSLQKLTMTDKSFGGSDGFTFQGQPIINTSISP